jgi:hypothetical protein
MLTSKIGRSLTWVFFSFWHARVCYNCGDVGHIDCDCPKPFNSNCGRGRGGTRGATRGARGCVAEVATQVT